MGVSISLLLAAIGAVLLFAVENDVDGVNFDAIGAILLIVSGIGLIWSLFLVYGNDDIRGKHHRHDHD